MSQRARDVLFVLAGVAGLLAKQSMPRPGDEEAGNKKYEVRSTK